MASPAVAVSVDPDFEPAENWDDDFEFSVTPGPSTPASSARTRRSHRPPNAQPQGTTHAHLAVHAAGKRNSVTSSDFTMEDWDAESIVQGSPQRVPTSFTGAILGSGGEGEEEFEQTPTKTRASPSALSGDGAIVFHDPHALPVSLSIALAPWSEEPETLLPRTPVKARAPVQHTVEETENWDQDFQESDEPTEDAPRKKLSLRTRLEEEGLESWDDEFALEEAEAEARQGAMQQMSLGMGPPPPASRRTPKKSLVQQRRREPRDSHGSSSSSGASSDSEGEARHVVHSYRRQKPNRHSVRSNITRRSWSEDGDFYDSSDDEFGMRRGQDEEEDKTVTSRSSKSFEFLKQRKDSSPPPPVPKLPDSMFKTPASSRSPNAHRSPSSVVSGPSPSPKLPFSPPPLPSASSPTPFPRSPTSSVFSMPGTVAETRSYTSTTHLRPIESRASSGAGNLANLSPSPPAHKDRERRRLRKKSRPSGHAFEMGTVSGRGRPRKSGESIAAYPYSFSDGELEDIRERDRERELEEGAGERIVPRRDRRTPSPPPQPHASGMLSVPGVRVTSKSDDGHSPPGKQREEGGPSVPPTPKGAGALLSRIGSLTNRLGGRKKRGSSVAPSENENHVTPHPQSSRSSLHLPHDPNSASPGSAAASLNPNLPLPSSSSWFFRSSSNISRISAPSSHKTGRKSLGSQPSTSANANGKRVGGDARASLSVTDLPNHDESEYEDGHAEEGEGAQREWEYNYEQEWGGGDDRTPVATPSKLVKRKSLGFVQLRRNAIAGGEKHKLKVKDRDREGKEGDVATAKKKKRASDVFLRATPSKEGKGDPFVVPFVGSASASASSYASSTPYLNATASDQSPDKDGSPRHNASPSSSGIRGLMGNVRRLSIVGAQAAAAVVTTRHRHKRTQSSSAVPGGSTSPDSVARASLNVVRDKDTMNATPIRQGGVSTLRRRETEKDSGKDRPLSPSTSVPALQKLYNAGGPAGNSGPTHGRKRSGTDVGSKSWAEKRREEKENCPVVTDSGTSGTDRERESEKEREAAVGTASAALSLPPIELQPPSPQKAGDRVREAGTQRPSLESFSLNLDSESPTAVMSEHPSSTLRAPRQLRDHRSRAPQSASVGRASPLQPPPPSAFNDPLSSSTTSNASTVKESKPKDPQASTSASGAVFRRNSLGDLKIPARISQAQVSLRRDLGMVREFAGAVESLKGLQDSYHALSGELHSLLERHAQASAAAQTQATIPTPASVETQSRPPSSSGFFNLANLSRPHLKLKGRKRSNTNPEMSRTSLSGRTTPYNEENVNMSSAHLPLPPGPSSSLAASQAAYKDLATALYCINSKYKVSWECADLLIELGSGTTNTDAGAKASAPLVVSSSASAIIPSTSQPISPQRTASGRERAITLAGDDRDASRASTPASMSRASSRVGSYGLPGHAPPIASPLHGFNPSHSTPAVPASVSGIAASPPLASPASWRASTGRNDLSQRQLALLRDMLGSERSSQNRPIAAPHGNLSAGEPKPSPSLFEDSQPISPNREWRWGADAMSSTITLPLSDDEDDGQTGTDVAGDRGKGKKPRKKKLMSMSGFRDMLRALRRTAQSQAGKVEVCKQHNAIQGQQALLARSGAAGQSTASLSAESSFDGHSLHNLSQHPDQHVHHHRSQQAGQPSQVQRRVIQKRRPKSSAGPEEILAHQRHLRQLQESQRPPIPPTRPVTPPPTFSMTMPAPPKSPRRPSLASIFRIGSKNSQQPSSGNVTDSSTSYANGNSSSSCLDVEHREEEDWDQIDAVSDLDGLDTTIRGAGSKPQVLEKKMKKRMMLGSGRPNAIPSAPSSANEPIESGKRSPYLQQDPYAYRSTSGLGRRVVSAGAVTPNSANTSSTNVDAASNVNASQASLGVSSPIRSAMEGQPPVPNVGDGTGSVRQTKLSDVQENEAGEAATRASASLSRQTAQAFIHPKGPAVSPHTSRSVSASSKFTSHNTGSVRSALPQAFSPGPPSSGSPVTSPHTGVGSSDNGGYPDIKLTFTPENIKPLLENAKEVQKALRECVEELRELVRKEGVRLGVPVEATRQAVHDRVSSA